LVITADYWEIEKDKTIGLFGRNNHTVLDMMKRFENGLNSCSTFQGHSAVVREAPDDGELAYFAAAGVCPFGSIKYVADEYMNLAKRTIEGYDVAVYYDVDTPLGNFDLRYIGSFIEDFYQAPSGQFKALTAAKASGLIPADIPIDGFGDLLGKDGNYDNKHSLRLSWRRGPWGATLTGLKKGSFTQEALTLSDGRKYVIPSMRTMDLSVDYRFELYDTNARLRFAVKNFQDERAPLADRYYGYFADAHQDLGRNYYLDLRLDL